MRLKSFFLIFVFFSPVFLGIQSGFAAEKIRSIKIETEVPERNETVRAIIRIKEGDNFDPEKVENAIYDLRKWGIYKNVEVLVEHEAGDVSLVFQLQDAFLIKTVDMSGNYPILEKDVKKAIFMTPGDVYQPERIPEQVARLIAFYEKEGYRQTSVTIEEKKDLSHRMITLKVKIKKGKDYRVGDITVKGNHIFLDSRIKNKITRIFGFSPKILKKDVESIEKLYHTNHHPRVRVKATVQFDEEKRKANITLEIREGKKVVVVFEGNEHQLSNHLRKIVGVTDTGDYDEFELDHSKSQLIEHYHSLGYEGTEVAAEKKELNPQTVQVLFKIQEGTKRVIKSIDFEGNKAFSDKKLKTQMLTEPEAILTPGVFSEEAFKQDLQTIESFYQANGFIEAKVDHWKKDLIPTRDKYRIQIRLTEKSQTKVEKVDFEGLKLFTPVQIKKLLNVKEGNPYSVVRLEDDVRAILVYYANHGHPYAEAKTEVEEVAPYQVKVHYKILEGAEVRIGKTLFVGNFITQDSTIRKTVQFKQGDLFNPKQILQSQTFLRKLGVFDALSLETLGLKGREEVVHLVVRVEEKKIRTVDLGFSYDTDTKFKGTLNYTHLNLLGWAKQFSLKLTGGNQFNRAEIDYTDPRLFGSSWQYLNSLFAQFERRPYFQDIQTGGSTALIRELTRKLSVLLKYELIQTTFNDEKTDFSQLRPGTNDNTTGKFQFLITYDGRDNFGDPHSGIYASGTTAFGTEFTNATAKFFKLNTRTGHWWSPFHRFTIANALRLYAVVPVTVNDQVPAQELVFLGGDDTLRGFREDALNPGGGKVAFVHNLEFQMRLFKGVEAVLFMDTGSLVNNLGEMSLYNVRHSAGGGIRYITPVGPVRLDYGVILNRQPTDPNRTRLHFTFGYFF